MDDIHFRISLRASRLLPPIFPQCSAQSCLSANLRSPLVRDAPTTTLTLGWDTPRRRLSSSRPLALDIRNAFFAILPKEPPKRGVDITVQVSMASDMAGVLTALVEIFNLEDLQTRISLRMTSYGTLPEHAEIKFVPIPVVLRLADICSLQIDRPADVFNLLDYMRQPLASSDGSLAWPLKDLTKLDLHSALWLEPQYFMAFVRSRWQHCQVDQELSLLSGNAPILESLTLPVQFDDHRTELAHVSKVCEISMFTI